MEGRHTAFSDEVMIEIVHSIKDILIQLISCAFSQVKQQTGRHTELEV